MKIAALNKKRTALEDVKASQIFSSKQKAGTLTRHEERPQYRWKKRSNHEIYASQKNLWIAKLYLIQSAKMYLLQVLSCDFFSFRRIVTGRQYWKINISRRGSQKNGNTLWKWMRRRTLLKFATPTNILRVWGFAAVHSSLKARLKLFKNNWSLAENTNWLGAVLF